MGGLTSFIWNDHAQTSTDDKDLGTYTSFARGNDTGFNIIGVNRATGMIIVLNKNNGIKVDITVFQALLMQSGVDYAVLTDGSASIGCWSKANGYVSLGVRQVQPLAYPQINTVTSYIVFSATN